MKTSLVMITECWPWSGAAEESFIEPEIPHLLARFSTIRVLPLLLSGERRQVPVGVEVDSFIAERHTGALHVADWLDEPPWDRNLRFGSEIEQVARYRSARLAKRLLFFARDAFRIRSRLGRLLVDRSPTSVIVYSYWCGAATLGAILARPSLPMIDMKIVTRVHGHDLFEERHNPPVLPFRAQIMRDVDAIVCASQAAVNHLATKTPEFSDKVHLFRLGVKGALPRQRMWERDNIVLVSCSGVVDLKRVDLIFESVAKVAINHPTSRIEWTHFGDGPGMAQVRRASEKPPANLRVHLPGAFQNAAILRWYADNRVDALLHLSRTEGGCPVAIQEALSSGIPVIAAAAGGVSEAVDSEVGQLLPNCVTPSEVALAVDRVLQRDREELAAACRKRWSERFDADVNHARFASFLAALGESRRRSAQGVAGLPASPPRHG